MNIVDWNRGQAQGKVFHFKNSLRRFIAVDYNDEPISIFVDLDNFTAYNFDELEYEDLDFYRDETEEDLDFLGVDLDF